MSTHPLLQLARRRIGVKRWRHHRNTSLFDPAGGSCRGLEKRHRDWKKWGHGHLNITKP
ncbi:hypothetical protein KCP71_24180 [Salmonella enterica subsp. enterica]|nr:hypothetical protein KCP71_24180 [Salmonella enterica subsp. enterica]